MHMKIFLCLLLITFLINSCENKPAKKLSQHKPDATTTSAPLPVSPKIEKDTVIQQPEEIVDDTEVTDNDSINFKKFAVTKLKKFNKPPLNWKSNPGAKDFKTRITDAYQSDTIDFAGNYISVIFWLWC